jgi:lysophospholipase L1-like esterase
MANEFNIKHGLIVNGDITLTGNISGANIINAQQILVNGVAVALSGQGGSSLAHVADDGTGVLLGDVVNNSATGAFAVAAGKYTTASGAGSFAGGYNIGGTICAYGLGSHAEGFAMEGTIYASDAGSHAEGYAKYSGTISANAKGSHAEGYSFYGTISTGPNGFGARAEGFADGVGTICANGQGSHAEGYTRSGTIIANSLGSHAEGYIGPYGGTISAGTNINNAKGSHAEGFICGGTISTNAKGSHSEGYSFYGTISTGPDGCGARAEGWAGLYATICADGQGSHAEGWAYHTGSTISTSNEGSHAEGFANYGGTISANGYGSHAEGYAYCGTISANGNGSHAEGYAIGIGSTIAANGEGSFAGGRVEDSGSITTCGRGSRAEGFAYTGTISTGFRAYGSRAEGSAQAGTISTGYDADGSHAEGYATGGGTISTSSHAKGSHAEGYAISGIICTGTCALGSHAEGYTCAYGTISTGNNAIGSHAEGYSGSASDHVIACGKGSHAQGTNVRTLCNFSQAIGSGARANDNNSFVWSDTTEFASQGQKTFNIFATNGVHISGGSLNTKNVNIDGNVTLTGNISGANIINAQQVLVNGDIDGNTIYGTFVGDGSWLTGISGVDQRQAVGSIIPDVSGQYDLGSPTRPWRDLYLTNNSIKMGDTTLSISNNTLNVAGRKLIDAHSSNKPYYAVENYVGWKNKKIVWIGDSTTDNRTGAVWIKTRLDTVYSNSGDVMEGVTHVNHGENGNTLINYINGSPAGRTLNDSIAENADLYIFSYGINDVRTGAINQTQLEDRMRTAIERLLNETDGNIILRIPNSFSSDNYNNFNYVSPAGSYQTYTDLLRNAYLSFKGVYSRVTVLDVQEMIFGTTCVAVSASNGLLADQLHPSTAGYNRIGDLFASVLGVIKPFRNDLAYAENYTTYPRYLEYRNDKYDLIAQGYFVNMASSYLDFGFPSSELYKIKVGDIVKIGDALAYAITGTITSSAANTRILQTFTDYANNNKGMVKVFREKGKKVITQAFAATNFNGVTLHYFSITKARITAVAMTSTAPIPNAMTFDLISTRSNASTTIGRATFTANNMTSTFAFDVSGAPSGYYDISRDDFVLSVYCNSSGGFTGTGIFNFNMTTVG